MNIGFGRELQYHHSLSLHFTIKDMTFHSYLEKDVFVWTIKEKRKKRRV